MLHKKPGLAPGFFVFMAMDGRYAGNAGAIYGRAQEFLR
jgi:hypothetical protein